MVNPNRLDEDSPHGGLAAVGVAFLLVVAVNRALRRAGWYGAGRAEPDLLQWLDLVALGTVCDVVPLTGLNRALVAQGIKVARRGANPGMAALAAIAGINEPLDAYHLGFVLGPRVNAGGRVGAPISARGCWRPMIRRWPPSWRSASTATTASAARSRRGPWPRRSRWSKRRRKPPVLVFAAAEDWHPGVIGIVAARLKERYERPALRRRAGRWGWPRLGPLDPRRRARPGGDRGAPGRAADQWRRPRDGGRLYGRGG